MPAPSHTPDHEAWLEWLRDSDASVLAHVAEFVEKAPRDTLVPPKFNRAQDRVINPIMADMLANLRGFPFTKTEDPKCKD